MPELPELEVVREVLERRVVGRTIEYAEVLPPGGGIIVRNLCGGDFTGIVTGASIGEAGRRGKFLLLSLRHKPSIRAAWLVLNLKLTGRLQLAQPSDKRHAKTHVVFGLSSGDELRYVDQKTMGQMYLTDNPDAVPEFAGMGPEALEISREDFISQLRSYRGEIKGVLVRGEFVAGIGNAYADEILWAARLHPYRKRTSLKPDEINRLYDALRTTLLEAIVKVRSEMGDQIHQKPRDFLNIHMKTGEPCPRCRTPVSLVGANQRITNFCRNCQPGGLIRGM